MTDQLRFDAVGSNSFNETPNLDSLAADGVVFDSCYANAPVCIPSRFSLATGASPNELGIFDNIAVDLNPNQVLWTNLVKEAGYKTSVIGKTHLHRHHGDLRDREHLVKSYGFDFVDEIGGPRASTFVDSNMTDLWKRERVYEDYLRDFDDRFKNKPHVARPTVLPEELYADNYVGRVANEILNNIDLTSPWFCWVSFSGPHEPWDAPLEYCKRFAQRSAPKAITPNKLKINSLPTESLHYRKHNLAPILAQQDIDDLRKNYAANVALIDERIGDLISTLKSRGVYENTLIIFTSDHGEMNGDHGLLYKNVLYEQAVKVPLIVVPNIPAAKINQGSRRKAKIQLSDLGKTILELCDIPPKLVPALCYGKSFAHLFKSNSKDHHRKYIFSEVAEDTMVFDGRWKLIFDRISGAYMLFDLKKDPQEQENLAFNLSSFLTKRRLIKAVQDFKNVGLSNI